MSNMDQCSKCRLGFDECSYYDHTTDSNCSAFVKPIDNSKMFSHWYNFTGRIGRLEYLLTFIISVILYFFVILIAGKILQLSGTEITSQTGLYVFTFSCMLPSVYLLIAAGVKRAHDTRVSSWFALSPILPLLFINIITIVIFILGFIYLFITKGEEDVNEYGTVPNQPFSQPTSMGNM